MTDSQTRRRTAQFRHRGLMMTLFVTSLTFAACAKQSAPPEPQEITRETACVLDGMLLADYPGPKAQIYYEGESKPDFFCDTVEMLASVFHPEQKRVVAKIYVQDMGKADWQSPKGHWIDAHDAFYVIGSKMMGSMGPTFVSFARQDDAQDFARLNGGKVLKFSEIAPDMAKLDGGMSHDKGM